MKNASTFDWTDERVGELVRLWAQGLTAEDIAGRMGIETRSAVLGKINRLGLARVPDHFRVAKPVKPRPIRQPKAIDHLPRDEPIDLPPEPAANPVTLLELEFHHCRWPVDMPSGPMMYCGAGKLDGHSYCRRHCDMAYSKVLVLTRAEVEIRARRMAKMRGAKAA